MKSKIYILLSVMLGLALTACNDDDFNINTTPIYSEDSVTTGSADVTATSATFFGTVTDVENSSPSSYVVGFNYGTDENNLNQSVNGAFTDAPTISATVTGLTENTVIYYQAFLKLQGKLTFTGEIKQLITTDAKVTTSEASQVGPFKAELAASVTGAPAGSTYGIMISGSSDPEKVRDGLKIAAGDQSSFTVLAKGLAASMDYYYTGYADLGAGVVYGDEIKHFRTADYDFDVENDLVDLGLSVKWAKFNVGAESETETGGYYAFGDPTGTMTTTVLKDNYPTNDIYKSNLDVASRTYGQKLCLPNADQFKELFTQCEKKWETVDGVSGYRFTGPNGNSIFLPAAGSRTMQDINGEGSMGMYATGSIVEDGSKFAVAYNFSASANGRVNTPLYEGLSARAVSTAVNMPFNKEQLYNTWEIDYKDGTSIRFAGPVHFYGVDDSWRTVSNHEPIIGDSWSWEADVNNSWAFGDCSGELTLTEDGKIIVKSQDGSTTEGTYTIDAANKTITSTIDILHPSAMSGYSNYKTDIKILQLTEDKLSLGFFRDSEPATVSVNMIPQSKKYGLPVTFACVAGDWETGFWGTEVMTILPDDLQGKHSFTCNGNATSIMVSYLDISGLKERYPNALVTITDIRCDGNSIPFDGSKFFYGDIEDNGNFRVELFNIWGKGASGGVVVESPFSSSTNVGSDAAVNFSEKIEVDFAIVLDNHFNTGFVAVQNDWSYQTWGNDFYTPFEINISDGKYVPSTTQFDLAVNASCTNPIMMFLQTDNLYMLFPGAKLRLDEIKTDGKALTGWDGSKIVNTSADGAGVHHRLELFNCWGATANDCAFGTKDGDVMHELGFSSSVDFKWTLEGLFSKPQF